MGYPRIAEWRETTATVLKVEAECAIPCNNYVFSFIAVHIGHGYAPTCRRQSLTECQRSVHRLHQTRKVEEGIHSNA